MSLNDILQTAAVVAILLACAIYLIRRHRRHASICTGCPTPCPLKDKKKDCNLNR